MLIDPGVTLPDVTEKEYYDDSQGEDERLLETGLWDDPDDIDEEESDDTE